MGKVNTMACQMLLTDSKLAAVIIDLVHAQKQQHVHRKKTFTVLLHFVLIW